MKRSILNSIVIIISFSLFIIHCNAQGLSFDSKSKAAARYEIDAKRAGVDPTSKDALPRSREFLRLDSTYYVGWMYEGMYKYDRSSDYLGYKNAIVPLQKAFDLFEHDFTKNMRTVFDNFENFREYYPRYYDLIRIFGALKECYDNCEMPDKSIQLIDRIQAFHFQMDYGFDLDYQRSWIFHRNRFLTSKDFSFLKNSVQENEQAAFQACYHGLAFIQKYAEQNEAAFGASLDDQRKLTIYWNLALLHCYNKNYDSSEYYYEQLIDGGSDDWGNYGHMQDEIGNFGTAQEYFSKDLSKSSEHFLRESYYYLPELYTYAGKTKDAINMTQSIIAASGSTPGFGWYNIALARAYLYDGQLDSCEFALNKAANFKELHIGTTLTQSQYDLTINLLRVQLYDKKLEQEKFLNSGWWYSPTSLYNIASYKTQKMTAEYVVVNQLTHNPDRNRLLYDLFCSEATTTWDEDWYLMKDFSPRYFMNKYKDYQQTDKRKNIQRYFQLFEAKFKWQNGDEQDATKDLENIDRTVMLDKDNEKLFIGRLYEALAQAYDYNGDKNRRTISLNNLFEVYPQLVPFSNQKPSIKLSTAGVDDAVTKDVISELKDCNIDFTNSDNCPRARIQFIKKGNAYQASITVTSINGKAVVNNSTLIFKQADGVGKELALRIFGKGGALVFEPAPAPEKK